MKSSFISSNENSHLEFEKKKVGVYGKVWREEKEGSNNVMIILKEKKKLKTKLKTKIMTTNIDLHRDKNRDRYK